MPSRLAWLMTAVLAGAAAGAAAAADRPRVASINLCADQLVLLLADPEQIRTVSWLSADPEESLLAAAARRYPLNYGSAEELLRYDPDVVIGGSYTSPFTRRMLARLGYHVVELEPEVDVGGIIANLHRVAAALGQIERGAKLAADLAERVHRLARTRPRHAPGAVVVRAGGFTVGADSLAHELLELAGARNVAAELGLDRWGSLSVETLLRSDPDLLIVTDYRASEPSLANAALTHPALAELTRQRPTARLPAAYWACGLPESVASAELVRRALP